MRTIQYTEGKSAGILTVMSVSNYETLKENNPRLPTVYLHIDGKYCECIQYNEAHWVISSINYWEVRTIPTYLEIRYCEQKKHQSGESAGASLQIVNETKGLAMVSYDLLWEKNRELQRNSIDEKATIYLMTAQNYKECFEDHKAECARYFDYQHTKHKVRGETKVSYPPLNWNGTYNNTTQSRCEL